MPEVVKAVRRAFKCTRAYVTYHGLYGAVILATGASAAVPYTIVTRLTNPGVLRHMAHICALPLVGGCGLLGGGLTAVGIVLASPSCK